MFETLTPAPPDPILGLTEAFRKDGNPAKINLGVGVYKDDAGNTPVLEAVQQAEVRLVASGMDKSYLSIEGSDEYGAAVRALLFGADHAIVTGNRAVTIHTPGGTGALRVAADFIHKMFPGAAIWISEPTWANHIQVFEAAGLEVNTYPYFDATTNDIDLEQLLEAIDGIPTGDAILLHACCHNPTGVDPTVEQWRTIGPRVAARGLLPFADFAYQGFGDGIEADTAGLQALCESNPELLIASSFSKNFGLYNERVGALTLVGAPEAAETALSQLKICVRANYSNPPAHGSHLVTTILGDPALRALWKEELTAMRDRINGMRQALVAKLAEMDVTRDFSFIERQRGMFSLTGLSREQVDRLRQDRSIYIVGSGRINVAGLSDANLQAFCEALAEVV